MKVSGIDNQVSDAMVGIAVEKDSDLAKEVRKMIMAIFLKLFIIAKTALIFA